MDDQTLETRHAMRQAATSTAIVVLEQPTAADAYERESNAIAVPGISRDECIYRVELVMGLELDADASTHDTVVFPIKCSSKYGALRICLAGSQCVPQLVALTASVSDDELDA